MSSDLLKKKMRGDRKIKRIQSLRKFRGQDIDRWGFLIKKSLNVLCVIPRVE